MASVHAPTAGLITVATLVTLLVYWTAEKFAHVMARRTCTPRRCPGASCVASCGRGWGLVTASFLPLAALVGSSLLGVSVSNAVLRRAATAMDLLAAAGWRVGRDAELSAAGRFVSLALHRGPRSRDDRPEGPGALMPASWTPPVPVRCRSR